MSRISKLTEEVNALYKAKHSNRANWADWLFENHIFVVAQKAGDLADRFGAQKELCMAAALLHDIADTKMLRENEKHDEECATIAQQLLQQADFTLEEINIIIDDAIAMHGCKRGQVPQTLEGKVMASADALAHLQTDFYIHAVKAFQSEGKPIQEIRNWVLSKIERDYRDKMFFDEIRSEVTTRYKKLKAYINQLE